MKFKIEPTSNNEQRKLVYVSEDYAFDVEPSILERDFDIIVNKLTLPVVDNKIIQVSGFCPYESWITSDYDVPRYTQGVLKIIDKLESGFSYSLNNTDWPIYVNRQKGWVCIGNPMKTGEGVEFMNNAVAIIHDSELVSLWVKPQSLPD